MSKLIAFLGAGQMGRGMITNLCKAGHRLRVYNRSAGPLEKLADLNIEICKTPTEAVCDAELILSMGTNDAASEALWEGPSGALSGAPAAGVVAIECSTVSVGRVAALKQAAESKGFDFMDCPVAGRPDAALAGTLNIFAGGELAALNRAMPALEAMSKQVMHFGPVGSGIFFKLIYNAVGATQIASLAEAMAACRAAGLNLDTVVKAMSEGGTASPHVKLHAPLMASGDYPETPPFTPAGRLKDLGYAIQLIQAQCGEAPMACAAYDTFAKVDPDRRESVSDSQVVDFLGK